MVPLTLATPWLAWVVTLAETVSPSTSLKVKVKVWLLSSSVFNVSSMTIIGTSFTELIVIVEVSAKLVLLTLSPLSLPLSTSLVMVTTRLLSLGDSLTFM